MSNQRVISWFSCGAASAYSTFLALQKYPNLEIVYCWVVNEHIDNMKFLSKKYLLYLYCEAFQFYSYKVMYMPCHWDSNIRNCCCIS